MKGYAYVSKRNNVVYADNRGLISSDTYHQHEEPSLPMCYRLPIGTIVQAGISITLWNGFSEVTAAIGIIVEPPSILSERDYAVLHGKSRTHRTAVEMTNVVQLSPADAGLICRLRQKIVDHGEAHVKRLLDLVGH